MQESSANEHIGWAVELIHWGVQRVCDGVRKKVPFLEGIEYAHTLVPGG